MSLKLFTTINRNSSLRCIKRQYFLSAANHKDVEKIDIKTVDEKPLFDDAKYTDEEVERIRNKSRLNPQHYNLLHNKAPYESEVAWFHYTVKYKRRILGRYGLDSIKANPGIFWPSKEEIEDEKEYERVAYPWKLEDAWKELAQKRKEEKAAILARDKEVDENMKKMDKWKKDLEDKILKKEMEVLKAKERRERLIAEVRQHFGFKIDTKDERFKQLLEQKEKEEKKRKKAMKKEEQKKRLLEKLAKGAEENSISQEKRGDEKENQTTETKTNEDK